MWQIIEHNSLMINKIIGQDSFSNTLFMYLCTVRWNILYEINTYVQENGNIYIHKSKLQVM